MSWATHALAGTTPDSSTPASVSGPFPRPHLIVLVPADTLTHALTDPHHSDGTGDSAGDRAGDGAGDGEGLTPADLLGYGPIPASMLRDLATRATWRCGAVDPTTGTLNRPLGHHTHTPAYTPPQRLRRFTTVDWQHCSFPGCTHRADHCDLDHTQNWPTGHTCQCNLTPLCRHHHNLKTHTGWTTTTCTDPNQPPGTRHWTSPTGHTHHTQPHTTELRPQATAQQPSTPATPAVDDDSAPPF